MQPKTAGIILCYASMTLIAAISGPAEVAWICAAGVIVASVVMATRRT